MKYQVLILCALISLMTACKQAKKSPEANIEAKIAESVDPELAAKLYSNYTVDPKTQAQKDENLIIEYMVKRNLDMERYPNGLYYKVHKKGIGPNYVQDQATVADYRGFFLTGKIFDSSFSKGEPIKFKVGQMIDGWNQMQKGVNPGSEVTIIVPSYLAYGDKGFPGFVSPNTVIAFDVYFKKAEE